MHHPGVKNTPCCTKCKWIRSTAENAPGSMCLFLLFDWSWVLSLTVFLCTISKKNPNHREQQFSNFVLVESRSADLQISDLCNYDFPSFAIIRTRMDTWLCLCMDNSISNIKLLKRKIIIGLCCSLKLLLHHSIQSPVYVLQSIVGWHVHITGLFLASMSCVVSKYGTVATGVGLLFAPQQLLFRIFEKCQACSDMHIYPHLLDSFSHLLKK